MATIDPVLVAVFVVGGAPVFLVARAEASKRYGHAVGMTDNQRMLRYLTDLLTSVDAAGELRVSGAGSSLLRRLDRCSDERIAGTARESRSRMARSLLISLLLTGVAAGCSLSMYLLVGSRSLTAADAAIGVAALVQMGRVARGVVAGVVGLKESSLFLQDFLSFTVPSSTQRPQPPLRLVGDHIDDAEQTIVLDRITYSYPGADRPALHNLSATIRRGSLVAIVGENGAGKTTLAKVLLGLYEPQSGTISYDGRNLAHMNPEDRWGMFGVMFQEFVRYELTVAENIWLGDAARAGDRPAIEAAARAAGVGFAEDLPDGLDTVLSRKWRNGTQLSGGQWQRVALARAVFRAAPVWVLDEPTAALDPSAETELYGLVRALAPSLTVVLISHRLSSVHQADQILVLRNGELVQSGTHSELMAAPASHYADLFSAQLVPG